MKKIIIDDYEIYIEDGKMVLGKFKDYEGNEHCFEINEILQSEFEKRRREEWRTSWEKRAKIDELLNQDEDLFEIKISYKSKSAEEMAIKDMIFDEIIKDIEKLPELQNKRLKLNLIMEYSYSEIARIQAKDPSTIRRSVESGIKNFLKYYKKD